VGTVAGAPNDLVANVRQREISHPREPTRRGLVTRQRAADDGRVVLVTISVDGRASLEAVREPSRSLPHPRLRELDHDELAALVTPRDVLARFIASLQGGAPRG
jgi:hypothetical protein